MNWLNCYVIKQSLHAQRSPEEPLQGKEPMGGPRLERFAPDGWTPWEEEPPQDQLGKEASPGRDPTLEAMMTCFALTMAGDEVFCANHNPNSPFPCATRGEEVEVGAGEVGRVFSVCFYFHIAPFCCNKLH